MCVLKRNFLLDYLGHLKLVLTSNECKMFYCIPRTTFYMHTQTHTHIELEIPPSPQSFQACLLISTVNKLLCLRLAFHKPSQILGFCECCSQQAKEIYLLTHYVPGHNRKTCKKFKHCCYMAVHNLVRIS